MTIQVNDLLGALHVPPAALTDQRIPKKLLLEHGTPTPADRRLIETHVQELWWHASLKPYTTGIPAYHDEDRSYPELAVLTLTLRGTDPTSTKAARLNELVHRAVPYPLLLITHAPPHVALITSVAHKRHSQASHDQIILDNPPVAATLNTDSTYDAIYLQSLNPTHPHAHLHALYTHWHSAALAHTTSPFTGHWHLPIDPHAHRAALHQHATLERDIQAARAAARKERSLARRAELNLHIKALQQQQNDVLNELQTPRP